MYVTITAQSNDFRQLSINDMLNILFFDTGNNKPRRTIASHNRTYRYKNAEVLKAAFCVQDAVKILTEFNNTYSYLLDNIHSHYYTFYIAKKSGGSREINAPDAELSTALSRLKDIFEIDFNAKSHTNAYAYTRNRCAVDAVKVHQRNKSKWILKTDLSGFFQSTSPDFVYRMLGQIYPFSLIMMDKEGKNQLKSALSLAFLNGGLPMGTPLSPILTNIIMVPFDYEVGRWLRSLCSPENNPDGVGRRFVITRYADDIHISCGVDFDKSFIINGVKSIFKKIGAPYIIKPEKTHYGSTSGKNWMLGVMLNKDNEITIGWKNKKRFESMLFNYAKDRENGITWELGALQYILGLVSYYASVNKDETWKSINKYSAKFKIDIVKCIKDDMK